MRSTAEILANLEADGILTVRPEPLADAPRLSGDRHLCGNCAGLGSVVLRLDGVRCGVQCPACRGEGVR